MRRLQVDYQFLGRADVPKLEVLKNMEKNKSKIWG